MAGADVVVGALMATRLVLGLLWWTGRAWAWAVAPLVRAAASAVQSVQAGWLETRWSRRVRRGWREARWRDATVCVTGTGYGRLSSRVGLGEAVAGDGEVQ
ncbi:hypothetical protein E2562_007876 [Oryza meyeriana var. granulata]|uniref:Uncharacterized protein n=1 Tax=Oryza meyeriana var. granulata TaxID=110450 RepID=A0A6G1F587_9ORYZ|nr:hypothetical protein E2562_007876 [Oryza meyeriana var. granulata]